ncbi:hypothetical protein THASP1DRAFT_25673 [Thamnocephalis sphaerospora]|uniref:NAD-dependent epimerase/dehydratase domain-containing protein n=1 Tax=Thamnocephalis sphaerospora TaxID=78915 RepID=A0A4P9XJI4_9FUNG|nr:hypothetical protein THASP1DRAFT_25673 [Thamnocephalis sphaerospora]|eukprot:RKP05915.1 hypothetical protein THASP1DRAFT_25673 [Thamnocephalis sphaerospora]
MTRIETLAICAAAPDEALSDETRSEPTTVATVEQHPAADVASTYNALPVETTTDGAAPFSREQLSELDQEDIGERARPVDCDAEYKTIMITGGAGFILFTQVLQGDVTSSDFIRFLLEHLKVEAILHFAAQTHVDNSFGDSFEFTKNNVMGTHVLLEAAKEHGIKRFVHVSTDEVYGEVPHDEVGSNGSAAECAPVLIGYEQPACREETILAPSNPYSATKAAAECLVKAYHKSFGLPTIITRSNNVYGPYQYPEKACSKFICQLLRGQPCTIHGDGSNSRRYLYAADVADAIDVIFHRGEIGEIYNIGSQCEITNLGLAQGLIRRFAQDRNADVDAALAKNIVFVRDRALNDCRYAVNCSKLLTLGWRQRVDFETGIRKTIDWYCQFGEGWWGDIGDALIPHPGKRLPAPPGGW